MYAVPEIRRRVLNAAPVRPDGEYVLYWMIASRRCEWNFALDRAVEWARELGKPLVVFEPLRCDYRWASDRLHRFVLDGMADNRARLAAIGVAYYPYVEPAPRAARGLLEALAARACVVVTDDLPCFFLPRMVAAAAFRLPVCLEQVDSIGLLPLRAAPEVFPTAYSFRRFLQKELPRHLDAMPAANPFARCRLPPLGRSLAEIQRRWPPAEPTLLQGDSASLAALPIDHSVPPVATRGGPRAATLRLREFLSQGLPRYASARNEPDEEVTSGLSPYLHFGHISAHQVFAEVMATAGWQPANLAVRATGSRQGWWGTSPDVEAFLDQLITWRELGHNFCAHRSDYDRFESLPDWARQTLKAHARDEREYLYSLEQFETAHTHDALWNAAQTQLLREGRIHNYLRMLWGKKILEWTRAPAQALEIMIELNNKYALDGRDPNSYSGIFWCLGRYDRPWGPERPVFGTVRYMSSQNAARKLRLRGYLERFSPQPLRSEGAHRPSSGSAI